MCVYQMLSANCCRGRQDGGAQCCGLLWVWSADLEAQLEWTCGRVRGAAAFVGRTHAELVVECVGMFADPGSLYLSDLSTMFVGCQRCCCCHTGRAGCISLLSTQNVATVTAPQCIVVWAPSMLGVLVLSEAAVLLHALLRQRLAGALFACCRQDSQMSGCLMSCWPGTRLATLDNEGLVTLCGRAPAAASEFNQDLLFWHEAWRRPNQQTQCPAHLCSCW